MISFRSILLLLLFCTVGSIVPAHIVQSDSERVYSIEYLNALCRRMANQIQLDSKKITLEYDDAISYANVTSDINQGITTYHIRMNPHFVDTITRNELVAVMAHELMHIAHGDLELRDSLYQPLSAKTKLILAGAVTACAGGISAYGMKYKNGRRVVNCGAAGVAALIGAGLMSKLLLKYSNAIYSSTREFFCSRHGIATLASGLASASLTLYWTARHDDIVTRSASWLAFTALVGMISRDAFGIDFIELARKKIARYRFLVDNRRREAYADLDAAQKFHCAPGLISFFEKIKESSDALHEKESLLYRLKKAMKNHFLGTHPTEYQRIIALQKITPAAA